RSEPGYLTAAPRGLPLRGTRAAELREPRHEESRMRGRCRPRSLAAMRRKGSCLCGALRYEIEGDFEGVWMCHCSNCRKASGGAGNTIVVVPRDRFHWLS